MNFKSIRLAVWAACASLNVVIGEDLPDPPFTVDLGGEIGTAYSYEALQDYDALPLKERFCGRRDQGLCPSFFVRAQSYGAIEEDTQIPQELRAVLQGAHHSRG